MWYLGPTTWQLEGKRYKNAERVNTPVAGELYEVAVGPTLEYERAITEDSSATLNSQDVWGSRLRVDWTAVPAQVVPYVSAAVFRDVDVEGACLRDDRRQTLDRRREERLRRPRPTPRDNRLQLRLQRDTWQLPCDLFRCDGSGQRMQPGDGLQHEPDRPIDLLPWRVPRQSQ